MKKIHPVKADSYVFIMDNLIPSGNKGSVDKQCNNYERLTSETAMWFNKKALQLFSESIFSHSSVNGPLSLYVFRVINITVATFWGPRVVYHCRLISIETCYGLGWWNITFVKHPQCPGTVLSLYRWTQWTLRSTLGRSPILIFLGDI